MTTKRVVPKLEWSAIATFGAHAHRGDRSLFVAVQTAQLLPTNTWTVMAIETSVNSASPQAVFDDHNHAVVGVYDDVMQAMRAAESYALSWLKNHKQTQVIACECEGIVG